MVYCDTKVHVDINPKVINQMSLNYPVSVITFSKVCKTVVLQWQKGCYFVDTTSWNGLIQSALN